MPEHDDSGDPARPNLDTPVLTRSGMKRMADCTKADIAFARDLSLLEAARCAFIADMLGWFGSEAPGLVRRGGVASIERIANEQWRKRLTATR